MTDQIADLIIRIKNAKAINKYNIVMPFSKMKEAILRILKTEGYIAEYKTTEKKTKRYLEITLDSKPLTHLKQISKPGQRIYTKSKDIPRPLRGLGLVIISTPKGVISAKEARKSGVGGELICEIW